MSPPVFIIGNPRSGTTLLRLMVTCHRNIVVPPECGFAVWLYPKYSALFPGGSENPFPIEAFTEDVLESRKMETWNLQREPLRQFLERAKPSNYAEAVSAVYFCYAEQQGRRVSRWGDKNNYYLHHIDTLYKMYPEAFFVHIVRDGRDVACSYKALSEKSSPSEYAPQLPSAADEIAREWSENIKTINASFKDNGITKITEIRFEDLVRNTEQALRTLCTALQEEYDPEMTSYYRENRSRGLEPKEFLNWKQRTLEPPDASTVGKFRQALSPEEQSVFEHTAGTELRRYGYL